MDAVGFLGETSPCGLCRCTSQSKRRSRTESRSLCLAHGDCGIMVGVEECEVVVGYDESFVGEGEGVEAGEGEKEEDGGETVVVVAVGEDGVDKEGDLECDGAELEDDAPGVESGLAVGGDSDVNRDGDHVDHGGEGVEGTDGETGGEVEVAGHGDGLDEMEDVDEEEDEGGAERHVDNGEGDREGLVIHLLVEDVFVVDNDAEGNKDLDGDIGVREEDLFITLSLREPPLPIFEVGFRHWWG
ncbi:hypothetical protein ACFX2I_014887 [Malus domestica]